MLKSFKRVPLFFLFISLVLVNSFFIYKCYVSNKKTTYRNQILAEIDDIKNDNSSNINHAPFVLGAMTSEVKLIDSRSANLKSFFRKYNSDLYDDAEYIVAISDKYGFDYRLLPAIAMQESNLCKYIPENSYNCWGWGIYGDQVLRFDSYREAIATVAEGIKEHYINQGLVTPESIMAKYTPPSKGSWAKGVTHFIGDLE